MSTELVVQKAIRSRLVNTSAVTDLVPAANILDRHARPAPDPSIILGEDQLVDRGDVARASTTVFSTLHIWKKEVSLTGAKAIGGAIRTAIHSARLDLDPGFVCGGCHVESARYMRDPDGETSHGILTIETLVTS